MSSSYLDFRIGPPKCSLAVLPEHLELATEHLELTTEHGDHLSYVCGQSSQQGRELAGPQVVCGSQEP